MAQVKERRSALEQENTRLRTELEVCQQATASLEHSLVRFRAMFEQSPLSIQILSPDGRIQQVNRAWEQLFNSTLEQTAQYNMLADPQLIEKGVMPLTERGFAGEVVVVPPIRYDAGQVIAGGRETWAHGILYPLKDDEGKVVEIVLVHQDTTDWWRAEQARRETEAEKQAASAKLSEGIAREQEKAATERAEQLAKANHALKRNLDSLATQPQLEAFLQSVVNEAAAQTNAASAYLFLYDEHTDSLSLSVATDNGGDWRSVADMELWKRPFAANSTPAWETITSSRAPVVVELKQANPLFWAGTFEWHQQRGHTRAVTAPLWLGEKPLGFLGLASTTGETFTPEELPIGWP